MIRLAIAAIERRPSLGYISAMIAALPPWVVDLREWAGVLSVLVGLSVGIITLLIQVRILLRKKKGDDAS